MLTRHMPCPQNSTPQRKITEQTQIPFSDTRKARQRDLRNKPNSGPIPNKMKPLAHFAKRTQISLGSRSPVPRTKLIAIAMPASQLSASQTAVRALEASQAIPTTHAHA
jgi:hypothetical protein